MSTEEKLQAFIRLQDERWGHLLNVLLSIVAIEVLLIGAVLILYLGITIAINEE